MTLSYNWPRDEQRRYAEERLFAYIRKRVQPFHPYYRSLFRELSIDAELIFTYDDFRKLPLTERKDYSADTASFILQASDISHGKDTEPSEKRTRASGSWKALSSNFLKDTFGKRRGFSERMKYINASDWIPIHYVFSSGTTENPVYSCSTRSDVFNNISRICGMLYASGMNTDSLILNLLPPSSSVFFQQETVRNLLCDLGSPVIQAGMSRLFNINGQLEIASRFAPECICATPSYLFYWLKSAIDRKEDLDLDGFKNIRWLICVGEPVTDVQIARLKAGFSELGSSDVSVIGCYGTAEMRAAFYECSEGSGFHLNPELFYWELLDEEGLEPVKWGEEGVLVFSHIDWYGTSLIRYRTDDIFEGGMIWDKCEACGLTTPRLKGPVRRRDSKAIDVGTSKTSVLALYEAVNSVEGVDSFQLIIKKGESSEKKKPDMIDAFISAYPGTDKEVLRRRLSEVVLSRGGGLKIDKVGFENSAEIEKRLFQRKGLKADWIIDSRAASEVSRGDDVLEDKEKGTNSE